MGWNMWIPVGSPPGEFVGRPEPTNHELLVRDQDDQPQVKLWEPSLPTVDVNLIRVGSDRDLVSDESMLMMTRWICLQVGLNVGTVKHFRIEPRQAGALEIIDSLAEAEELRDRWSARNDALDVFVVRSMNVADGWSAIEGDRDRRDSYNPIVCGWKGTSMRSPLLVRPISEIRPQVAALREDTADVAIRAAAATWLSQFATEDAQPALLAALRSERSATVRHKIIAGLARIGEEDALPALSDLVRSDPELAVHAAFAQSVIAHRLGVGGYEPPTAEESPLAPAPHGARVSPMLEDYETLPNGANLSDNTYGLIVGPSVAGLRCGGRRLAVAIDLTALARLLTTPTIAGLVATRIESDGSLQTGMIVLSWPASDNTAHVAINRPSGTPAYAGSAKVTGSSVSFRLIAVRAPGARHATIEGTITSGILEELTIRTGSALPPQIPEPM